MVYSDSSTNAGIVEEARYFVSANTTSYPIADITRNVNRWFDKAVSLIFNADNVWQWDDANYTSYPIATTALVSGQNDYVFDVSHLRIERIEVKDSAGNWTKLRHLDRKQIPNAVDEFMDSNSIPTYYDVTSNSVFLYPAPNYSQAASLKIYFQRKGSYFTTTDTTKEPGFAEIFHRYLSLGAAYDYALKNGMNNKRDLRSEIVVMESDIIKFYSRREDAHRRKMLPKFKSSK